MTLRSTATEGADELVEQLLDASHLLADVLSQPLAARAGEVTPAQYEALVVLEQHGPSRPVELTEALCIDPSTTTRLCDRLLKRGFIERGRPEHNRREVTITLSTVGVALLDAIDAERRAALADLLEAIPQNLRKPFAGALDALLRRDEERDGLEAAGA